MPCPDCTVCHCIIGPRFDKPLRPVDPEYVDTLLALIAEQLGQGEQLRLF